MNKQEQKKLYIELDQLYHALANILIIGLFYVSDSIFNRPEMEFKEFEPRFKSAKPRFKLSAGINLESFDTILSGTNHI